MKQTLVFVTLIVVTAVFGDAQTFRKVKMIDAKDKEVEVQLTFDTDSRRLTAKPAKEPAVEVPYGNIDKLSYERSKHHRVKQGAILMVASLGAGAVVMMTSSKKHWFYVDYTDAGGAAQELILKLEKGDYKKILQAAMDQTGKVVETVVAPKDSKRPK